MDQNARTGLITFGIVGGAFALLGTAALAAYLLGGKGGEVDTVGGVGQATVGDGWSHRELVANLARYGCTFDSTMDTPSKAHPLRVLLQRGDCTFTPVGQSISAKPRKPCRVVTQGRSIVGSR